MLYQLFCEGLCVGYFAAVLCLLVIASFVRVKQ
jgi:hypothetical protein